MTPPEVAPPELDSGAVGLNAVEPDPTPPVAGPSPPATPAPPLAGPAPVPVETSAP
ncbi:hypothetical protein GCM10007977_001390 [Dactylosporangium sucinum]|uniref:Uncharacterized protein n=1 Tax=Dactylosporangium sucinum TaxID=1424081 RepID=A0A917T0D5_9ACTN|nr:hypothetical protein GCM10007977_001390 [Dactylosporangium sucinum]